MTIFSVPGLGWFQGGRLSWEGPTLTSWVEIVGTIYIPPISSAKSFGLESLKAPGLRRADRLVV